MKKIAKSSFLLAFGAFTLMACQTVPYETRVQGFEAPIKAKYIGKSVDNVILDMGPPNSNYVLSDGREVIQYVNRRTDRSSFGGTIAIGSSFGHYHNRGSVALAWPLFVPFYDNSYTERELVCIKRFKIGANKMVEDFKWEGNSCF